MKCYLLVDNGSLRPQATFNLRRLSRALSAACGERIRPASLLHSNRIPAEALDGEKAITLGPLAERLAAEGATELIVLPLFFGPSQALTQYLPERLSKVQALYPDLVVKVAMPLVDTLGTVDLRLARLLADNVREVMRTKQRPTVILVDHGSPIPEVASIRDYLAGQLSALLSGESECVTFASMERREGNEYRFNEPLLETLLAAPAFAEREIILAMLFLSPGRHAGEGGDIAEICATAMANSPGLAITPTRLVGEHDGLIELLADRLEQVRRGAPLLLKMPALH